MGVPFPAGLARMQARYPKAVRWAWSLNAAASVLGSATAIFLAIYIGLRATLLVSAGLYLSAVVVARIQPRAVEPLPASTVTARA